MQNESLILAMAEAMVSTGLKDLGFDHIHIDGGYLINQRDKTGRFDTALSLE